MEALNGVTDFQSHIGTKCEVRVLEERIKKNGEVEVLVKGEFKPSDVDPHARYALVTTRAFNNNNVLSKVLLQVNSCSLLKVFKDVVGFYPTIATDFDSPFEMEAPFGMLYHYWEDLESHRSADISDTTRMHLNLLLDFMKEELGPAKRQNDSMVRRGFVNYEFLWTIFKPGDLQYVCNYGHPRLLRLEKTFYAESRTMGKYFEVKCAYVDYDGEHFGEAHDVQLLHEKRYFGMNNAARITGLKICPRRFVKAGDELEAKLHDRGLHFLELKGVQTMRYRGKYEYLKVPPSSWYDPGWRYYPGVWLPREETGRVILDRKTFAEDYEDEQVDVVPLQSEDVFGMRRTVLNKHGELDPVLCSSFAYGFSLQHKLWCRFYVDCLEEISWKPNPMDALLLPDRQKRIMTALVTSHAFPKEPREESELKGKGLVILLHGSPGSGKTLSAETSAEATRRALLSITMGELSSDGGRHFEMKLREFLRLATTWRAIVLIDEADVFLEHRKSGEGAQAEKNALVAVFLRHLEYFQGIIFLTSNRVDVFDAAVSSRIHLALQYSPPTLEMRLKLWEQLLSSLGADELNLDIDEVVHTVRQVQMNGREIANTINSALTLARHAGETLSLEHIVSVVQVWKDFHESIQEMEEKQKKMPRQDSIVASNPQNKVNIGKNP